MTQGISMKLIPALVLAAFAGTAGASGFALQNQTGSGNGNAFAGAAASAEDAGTIYFNPAGMTYLPQGNSISLGDTVLQRSIRFEDTGTVSNNAAAALHSPRSDGGQAGGVSNIPVGYWAYSVSPAFRIGLGISPTFGNKTEYAFDFAGRNSGYFASMKQLNINPSIAFKASDSVSLGLGVNFAHNSTQFKQGFPLTALSANNFADIEGKAWATGYNLGAMFQLSPSTRLGLSYRSALKFHLKGTYSPDRDVAAASFLHRDIEGDLRTPANFSMAVSQKLSDKWEMLGDVTWTGWSVLNNLDLKIQQTGADLARLSYNFKDTWRVGLGANYTASDAWKLRFGVAHDKSPVRSDQDRTMTLPDSDRTWLSFGAKYSFSKAASMDFGYSHIFFQKAATNRAVSTGWPGAETLRQTVNGQWKNNSANLLSAQYNHSF